MARDTHLENASIALNILAGIDRTSRRDLIIVNASAILYLADEVSTLREGCELASNAIDDGNALRKVRELVKCSHGDNRKLSRLLPSTLI
jgi:anthranilate phosphoribosyltransferase